MKKLQKKRNQGYISARNSVNNILNRQAFVYKYEMLIKEKITRA